MAILIFGAFGLLLLGLPLVIWIEDVAVRWETIDKQIFAESFLPSMLCFWVVLLESGIIR